MGKRLLLCAAGLMPVSLLPAADLSGEAARLSPTAARLVQIVRQSENWIHDVNSFYVRFESTWTNTPEGIKVRRAELEKRSPGKALDAAQLADLLPETRHRFEIAFDKRRLRYLRDEPGDSFVLNVWDGRLAAYHENYMRYSREQYGLAAEPNEVFRNYLGDLSWLRAQPHSFWWQRIDIDSQLDFFGRPEHFQIVGRETFQDTDCHVLEYETREQFAGVTLRWYVGTKDHRLYGDTVLRDGQANSQHCLTDYRQVAPGCWFPMRQGYAIYDRDEAGRTYMSARRDSRAVEVHVNERLSDELFKIELREGAEVADSRFGQVRIYRYAPEVPDLLGKSIPSFDGIQLDREPGVLNDKPLLVCFWDPNQRPSRHCLRQLAEQAPGLGKRGIVLVAIQSVRTDSRASDPWGGQTGDSCRTGFVEGDSRQTQFTWGVRSLPWLILTDARHIVRAQGLGVDELDEKAKELLGE